MCFYIEKLSNRNKKEQTAKENITVYKVIFNDNTSYFQDFYYQSNMLYRLRKKMKRRNGKTINEGFHSFSTIERAKRANGYHGCAKIVEFTIPKGAKYYFNSLKEEYVSSSIRSSNLGRILGRVVLAE